MASAKDKVIEDIKKYISELNNHGIPVQKTILFGSWSRDQAKEESDIDIAIISESFSGDRFQDRRKIVPLRRKINNRIEPIPFDPESFATGGHIADEINHYGEVIW